MDIGRKSLAVFWTNLAFGIWQTVTVLKLFGMGPVRNSLVTFNPIETVSKSIKAYKKQESLEKRK